MPPILAVKDSTGTRLAVCGVFVVVGSILIVTGIHNIKTRSAEETGKARLFNYIFKRSNTYEGRTAVITGVLRIVAGVVMIAFGVAFIFVGPFLARH